MTLHYYQIYVASSQYHGDEALTYHSADQLKTGQVVQLPLQNDLVLGIVKAEVKRPSFATKAVHQIIAASVPATTFGLLDWLRQYYPAPLGTLLTLFLPSSLGHVGRVKAEPDTSQSTTGQNTVAIKLPPLTSQQRDAIDSILSHPTKSALIHGVTGSGKTRIYIELAKRQIAAGKSCLVLTPEIGLTPQLVDSFNQLFPGQTIVIHSSLTPAQRRDVWLGIANAMQPQIIIGPRSALFTPIEKLGLVVIDEAHDSAYKQESQPYFQASRVAALLAKLHNAQLVMGTANPLIADYYTFENKNLNIVKLTRTALAKTEQENVTTVVNLRDRSQFNRSAWLSQPLLEAVGTALNQSEQSLIFLNRRGTARVVICNVCGWQALCPRCDLPLTYHGDRHRLECHTCGYVEAAPSSCPTCGSSDIVFNSIGTKALVMELERLFPKARIERFDSDTKKSERIESRYDTVLQGQTDILVGTQVLGKGLDLPKLAIVGVVVADTALYFPDFTAEEQTFQMLTQVIGRVGRGHRAGQVFIQTYAPDNPTILQAVAQDYQTFYNTQIAERQLYHFPPFYFLLKLRCGRKSQSSAEQAAHKLAQHLLQQKLPIELSGPSAAFIEKNNNTYFWQIVIKSKRRQVLLDIINQLPANWTHDIDPTNLL